MTTGTYTGRRTVYRPSGPSYDFDRWFSESYRARPHAARETFVRGGPPRPPFGRAVPPWLRRLPWAPFVSRLLPWTAAIGLLEDYWHPGEHVFLPPGSGWVEYHRCLKPYAPNGFAWSAAVFFPTWNCLEGQAGLSQRYYVDPDTGISFGETDPGANTAWVGRLRQISPGQYRWDHKYWFHRQVAPTNELAPRARSVWLPPPPMIGNPGLEPRIDPNVYRQLPRRILREIAPLGEPDPSTEPAGRPASVETGPSFRVEISPRTGPRAEPSPEPSPGGVLLSGGPPPSPAPPKKGEKEKKVKTKGQMWGIVAFRMLDALSEWSESVDAFYQALPEKTRKRIERERRRQRKLYNTADALGQYGLAGADWKLVAVWQNWHEVDPVEAVRQLGINAVEDQLYGVAFRARSRMRARHVLYRLRAK